MLHGMPKTGKSTLCITLRLLLHGMPKTQENQGYPSLRLVRFMECLKQENQRYGMYNIEISTVRFMECILGCLYFVSEMFNPRMVFLDLNEQTGPTYRLHP